MRIELRKVRQERQPFEIALESAVCRGTFWRKDRYVVRLEGRVAGEVSLACDRCGEHFVKQIDETFGLDAVDRPLKVDESLDVVECPDGFVDFDAICESEIASIRSEYYLCPHCAGRDFSEIEF